jgi:hypothetical protein
MTAFELGDRVVDTTRPPKAQDPARVVGFPDEPASTFHPPARDDDSTVAGLTGSRFGDITDAPVVGVAFEHDLERAAEWWADAPGEILPKIVSDFDIRMFYFPKCRLEPQDSSVRSSAASEKVEVGR